MKRIVAYVFPAAGGSHDPPAEPVDERPVATGSSDDNSNGEATRDPLRIEALLSDTQAQRVLALLLEEEASARDPRVLIEEMLDRQLSIAEPEAGDLYDRIVLEVERQLLTTVFDECEHIKTRAADRLGIDRNTLHKKLQKYNLDIPTDLRRGSADSPAVT